MTGRVSGKVTIVTGGASGIGRATVKLLAAEGAKVIIADVNEKDGSQLAAEVSNKDCIFVRTNVMQEADIKACVDTAVSRFGTVHCLVNGAAGGSAIGPVENTTYEEFRAGTDLLLTGPFLAIKYATPHFKKQGGGAIVNIASLAGIQGVGIGIVYTAAKHGLVGLTRACADQLAEFNIRANVVAPGWIATPMHKRSFAHVPEDERQAVMDKAFAKKQPLKRAGNPQDIAEAVLYLLSDAAKFVTGQTIVVDGGLSAVSKAYDEFPTA